MKSEPNGGHDEPPDYIAEHLRQALARDPRVGELNLGVTIEGSLVRLTGFVPTPERRDAVSTVAHEALPGYEIRNDITSGDLPEPEQEEDLS